jgi:YVTN family beta-propeller protein
MHTRHVISVVVLLLALQGCATDRPNALPGEHADGTILLPNGWRLAPAGRRIGVGELPLNIAVTPDESYLLTLNNGTREHSISVVRTADWKVTGTLPLRKSWVGVRFFDAGRRLLVSGGNDNRVFLYGFHDGKITLQDSVVVGAPRPLEKIWVGGLDVSPDNRTAYVCGKESDSLYVLSLAARTVERRIPLAEKPYTCLASAFHDTVFVSLWGGRSIALLDRRSLRITGRIPVGDHPCDMVESPDGRRLFVANANENTVSVVDIATGRVSETITTALYPDAPAGSTPNALALDGEGRQLFIANADNNYLAVFDVSVPGSSRSMGFVPTGWYPTAVRVLHTSNTLVVANGKGFGSRANPKGPNPEKPSRTEEYIGSMFSGSLSFLPLPSARELEQYSAAVFACSPYAQKRKTPASPGPGNPVPAGPGASSPIKHVFYIIKENRTYDQVFGDMPEGNGDPSLCIFGEQVTPNHHALARQFVLLDNLYCDAEVSADGHNWSDGAYATDYVEKTWPTQYGGRGGEYDYQGGSPVAAPSAGYIWDNCRRHGVSFRSYGEFVEERGWPDTLTVASIEGLAGHVAPRYAGWNMKYSDVRRAEDWQREFDEYERNGGLPQFQIFTLPNDHTEGTRRGSLSPRAYVAQNDLALGKIVERISRSRFWRESVIFVIEDDAQNGADHVDAHRTVALVISPWTRHGFTDSEMYSTSSMVRTMGLILGLPPLSQFDAAATPMYASFAASPDTAVYVCRPARIDIEEKNIAGAYGQEESESMNFTRPDAIPDLELSEIVWRSVKGTPMPAPVRSAFVRLIDREEEDD